MQQEPKIIQLEEMQYVGLEVDHNVHESAKGASTVPNLWNSFSTRISEVKNQTGNNLGVCGPVRKGGMSMYVAAVQVENAQSLPTGMVKGIIPAGKYAVFIHRGPIATSHDTVSYIHNKWMPEAGYEDHDCSQIEVMTQDADVNSLNFEMKVLVPLFQ